MTELTWEGKYTKDGKKSAPVRIALPCQTIATINEPAQDRLRTLDLFARGLPSPRGASANWVCIQQPMLSKKYRSES